MLVLINTHPPRKFRKTVLPIFALRRKTNARAKLGSIMASSNETEAKNSTHNSLNTDSLIADKFFHPLQVKENPSPVNVFVKYGVILRGVSEPSYS